MSKYNHFAKDLNEAFILARDEYAAAFLRLQKAEQDNRDAGVDRRGDSGSDKRNRIARAALLLNDAKTAFEEVNSRVWRDFNKKRSELREELANEVKASQNADPAAIDNGALELMKTGILKASDYESFAERYADNATMLRLVSHYADEAAKSTDSRQDRLTLNSIAVKCRAGDNSVLSAWDDISMVANYCSGMGADGSRRATPQHAYDMGRKWEELAGEAVDNF